MRWIRLSKSLSIPLVLLHGTGNQIGGGKGRKRNGHHGATRQSKARPLQNFSQIMRTRDIVKRPIITRYLISLGLQAQLSESGIGLGIDDHAGECYYETSDKTGMPPFVGGKALKCQERLALETV